MTKPASLPDFSASVQPAYGGVILTDMSLRPPSRCRSLSRSAHTCKQIKSQSTEIPRKKKENHLRWTYVSAMVANFWPERGHEWQLKSEARLSARCIAQCVPCIRNGTRWGNPALVPRHVIEWLNSARPRRYFGSITTSTAPTEGRDKRGRARAATTSKSG